MCLGGALVKVDELDARNLKTQQKSQEQSSTDDFRILPQTAVHTRHHAA